MNRYSISEIARTGGLSRSTLLYYDRIGLLRSASRSGAGYRRYSRQDSQRLERIVRYRKAGLALKAIGRLLDGGGADVADVLAARLAALNEEILRLREQQRFVVGLLGRRDLEKLAFMSRERFVAMLKAGGFTRAEMERWHVAFEREAAAFELDRQLEVAHEHVLEDDPVLGEAFGGRPGPSRETGIQLIMGR